MKLIAAIFCFGVVLAATAQLIPNRRHNLPGGAGSGGGGGGGGGGITNVTRSLADWWKFDEGSGTTAADSAGSATGTLISGPPLPSWVTGQIGDALSFGLGDGSFVQLAANLPAGNSGLTVTAWIKMTSGGAGYIIADLDSPNFTKGLAVRTSGTRLAMDAFDNDFSVITEETVSSTIAAGTWVHTISTWDGSQSHSGMHLYTNNVEATYDSGFESDGTGTHAANTTTLRSIASDQTGHPFAGIIDDVRVYTRVLDATERSYVYQWSGQP